MDDNDMDFRRPTERREPKQFEPPPWEHDAFAELERKRQEEEQRRLAEEKERQAQERKRQEAGPAGGEGAESAEKAQPHQAPPEQKQVDQPEPEAKPGAPELEERVVIEMLAGLAAEEPSPRQHYSSVAIAVGAVVAVLGAVMVVWAIAALVGARRSGVVGTLAGSGLGMFGVFFLGMGAWMVYRALKQRGVL